MLLRKYLCCGPVIFTLIAVVLTASRTMQAQAPAPQPVQAQLPPPQIAPPSSSDYQGSVVAGKATSDVLALTLDQAIGMGLKNNLGAILQSTNVKSAGGEKLQQLQNLLPSVYGTAQDSVAQVNLQAEGLRIPGFPAVIGPFAYTDFRARLNQTLFSLNSIQNYIASRHNLTAAKFSAKDTEDFIVLTVGNAYLLCVADDARVASIQSQVDTSQVSLNQAIQNHQNGVSPRLDELRARVDYQTQEQNLISARNQLEKDKIALARVIGLPLDQQFSLADKAPYAEMTVPTMDAAMAEAVRNRKDLKAAQEQIKSAERSLSAAHADRYPVVTAEVDYGYIGVNPNNSYGTLNANGTVSGPIFEEGRLRGEAEIAKAQLQQARAQENNLEGQIRADVKDAILDMEASQKLVSVSHNNVDLADEALREAQERFQAGVSDNLAVSEAQSAVAQADDQYVSSLYQFNVAKLSLARATGVARAQYKSYLGGQ